MAWFYIIFADLFEVAWPFVLKWSAPISSWAPLFVGVICSVPINYLLAEAVKRLPAATVYATFCRHRDSGNGHRRNALFCREHEHRPGLFSAAHRSRPSGIEVLLGGHRIGRKAAGFPCAIVASALSFTTRMLRLTMPPRRSSTGNRAAAER